ncbi:MAG: glutathione S-transferase [Candidatus Tokpelaia sp. JSC189]|nr:MAG: glutathione S-transferase [Candidatus Tokpelaia sp. JSC189]
MKLFYTPGACSLAPHIVLYEACLEFDSVKVSLKDHTTEDGINFYQINPLGYVPLLVLDDGGQLTEGPAIVQYLADQAPEKNLAPSNGTIARYRLQSLLNFISSELHKGYSPLFNPATPKEYKSIAIEKLKNRYNWIEEKLDTSPWLTGGNFTVADVYLFVVTNFAKVVKVDLTSFVNLSSFMQRVNARSAVQAALKAESLF